MQSSLSNSDKSKILFSVIGPTAIGKTRLSIDIAQHLNTEIISCDSRQFYKEMKIGTAFPTKEELNAVPHHFIGNLSILQEYSVGEYEKEAITKITNLFQNYNQVVMVGGSGLYEKAVNEGLDEFPHADSKIKASLIEELESKGIEYLQEKLLKVDPEYYYQVDVHNPSRIIRALEVYEQTGKPYSAFRKNNKKSRNFTSIKIGLTAPREIIYDRINQRVDKMMQQGLLEEVRELLPYRNTNALLTVGYRELFDFLDGVLSLEKAIEEIKKNSRRYAKRQLTWYRRDNSVHWFEYDETESIIDFVLEQCKL
ncbi:tRNA (adenosine(37)-N6)-dimethylallyltransferase MiaA [Apibacter sp. HY039]|uniref:tRNA (adenosine(37)-N6)-dimethylallyltransferase MiaA n=1 Tax=Apibacter sp. HY039 TaxID=2501476 RepID=UPI000FEBAB77|nr:tRNA (adenosine(37)-N6)-dimethylallyltransferase MiaA [Apibacter sp. HY039]